MFGWWKKCKEIYNNHGWHILLVGLLLTFIVLFIVNQFTHHASSRSVGMSDIYDHFMTMLFNPHRGEQRQRRQQTRRTTQQGGSSKGESKCKEFVEFFFQQPFDKCRPQFLQNPVTKENLELDMFNADLALGIEYNGAQHYNYNSFMHNNSKDKFYNQQYRDLIKKDLCEKNNIRLIVVPYTVQENQIASFLFEELKKLGYTPHPDAFSKLT